MKGRMTTPRKKVVVVVVVVVLVVVVVAVAAINKGQIYDPLSVSQRVSQPALKQELRNRPLTKRSQSRL